MKFLLLLAIILLAVWLWRSGRDDVGTPRQDTKRRAPQGQTPKTPQDMVRCAHCGLHLPLPEAVASQRAHYCSAEHRQQAEPRDY